MQKVSAQITWSDNLLIIDKVKEPAMREWYINETIKNGWSYDILEWQIDSKLYERQAVTEKITNFQNTLPDAQSDLAMQTMKDPYIFGFVALKGKVKELEIENAMINKIKDVLIEFGVSEYKLLEDIPEYLQAQLLKAEDIELHIQDIEEY